MTDDIRQQAIALYDRFTHDGMDRRLFMGRMVALAGSLAAAEALVASIASSPAAASVIPATDKRLRVATTGLLGNGGFPLYQAYTAAPRGRTSSGTVLVIHENRGLNDHIRDVARRVALAGFYAIAPDMLSPEGGTPANEDKARDMIGKLDLPESVAAASAMVRLLAARSGGNGKVGAVGFCWGGAFVDRLAVSSGKGLAAGVSYYGPAPEAVDAVKIAAPMMFHFAGLDERVAKSGWPFVAALGALGKPLAAYNYPGVNHAFNNDTSKERFDKAAADLSWGRTLGWFKRYL